MGIADKALQEWKRLHSEGREAWRGDFYQDAEKLLTAALAVAEQFGQQDVRLAESLFSLAKFYSGMTSYKKAEPLFLRALAIREKSLGRDHPDVAENLYRPVLYHRATNLESEADGLHKRALEIWGKNLGAESTEFAAKVQDMAYSFDMRRDFGKDERVGGN